MRNVKVDWSYFRDCMAIMMETIEGGMRELERARKMLLLMRELVANEAMKDFDELFPQYKEENQDKIQQEPTDHNE